MTRKERLEYELSTGESILEEFERYVPVRVAAERIVQAEREVWEQAAKIAETEGVYPELNCALGGASWYQHGKCIAARLRQQQEGL